MIISKLLKKNKHKF